ncbi:hypothetical protein PENTCL1PPCAC_6811 [Pristionchus entomophagus]|uniref:Methyltransferase n=1 Tax=Pristionchus entomophagus TaxID=358040 RepID=A0AAV5SYM6_9BILA|nr:hypothetical protein PENTCL1PPCAC_6811 [Pristionchus entomophagus]
MTTLIPRFALRSFSVSPSFIFDRSLKRKQRDWSAIHPSRNEVEYIREELGWRVGDRVADLTKHSERVLEIGHGMISAHLESQRVSSVTLIDSSQATLDSAKRPEDEKVEFTRVIGDEESLSAVQGQQFDLILSSMVAHWINDLPGWMRRVHSLLKPDCPFIGTLLAEDTLYELRCSLQLAEMERLGGMSSHLSPLVRPTDIGSLLGSNGFRLVTLDSDEIQISYPSMLHLLDDLQLMGESNCSLVRPLTLRRDIAIAASAIYQSMYGKDDAFPCTFRVLSFIGWTDGPTTPQPAKRGSQTHSFKEISQE